MQVRANGVISGIRVHHDNVKDNRAEREDSLWEFLQRESSGQLQYKCPSCQIPILVGKHSITIDRDRIEIQRTLKIEDAAKHLLDNLGVDLHGGDRPIPVEASVIDKLREALSA